MNLDDLTRIELPNLGTSELNHRKRKSLELLSDRSFDAFLDVGCGDGRLTARIADACDATEIHGIDICEKSITRAEERDVSGQVVDLDEEAFPFDDEQLDLVNFGEVVDYLQDPDHCFSEINRVLRDGGAFVVSTPNLTAVHNRVALALGKPPFPCRGSTDILVTDGGPSPLAKRKTFFTASALEETLRNHGFKVETVVGSTSYREKYSPLVGVVDRFFANFPSLSYRVIVAARKKLESDYGNSRIDTR